MTDLKARISEIIRRYPAFAFVNPVGLIDELTEAMISPSAEAETEEGRTVSEFHATCKKTCSLIESAARADALKEAEAIAIETAQNCEDGEIYIARKIADAIAALNTTTG